MNDWLNSLRQMTSTGEQCVLVSVVKTLGSTPRELGAKMIVTEGGTFATIGGGRFEYECMELARKMLRRGILHKTMRFALGPSLGQCCGGAAEVAFELIGKESAWVDHLVEQHQQEPLVLASTMGSASGAATKNRRWVIGEQGVFGKTDDTALDEQIVNISRLMLETKAGIGLKHLTDSSGQEVAVLLEPMHPSTWNIVLFGAGHVGKALLQVLSGLSCHITWVDSRQDVFTVDVPSNVICTATDSPQDQVDIAPSGAYFLVMTHSHPLDQAICEKILHRDDFQYCGLIGSKSKRKKFERRFLAHGLPASVISKLTCPIGIDGISGKLPAEIAIAVAAELMQVYEKSRSYSTQTLSAQLKTS